MTEKRGKKRRHLTKKMMNASAGADEVGGGRKSRRCVVAGEDMDVHFVADWMRSSVDELQRLMEKLEVVSGWRVVAGSDGELGAGA
jgi:hypothetical protein